MKNFSKNSLKIDRLIASFVYSCVAMALSFLGIIFVIAVAIFFISIPACALFWVMEWPAPQQAVYVSAGKAVCLVSLVFSSAFFTNTLVSILNGKEGWLFSSDIPHLTPSHSSLNPTGGPL